MEQVKNSSIVTTASVEKKRSPSLDASLEEVRILGISEYREAADCLAQAFGTDDVARYFFDTPDMAAYSVEYKWNLHVVIMRYVTAAHCYKGLVTTVGPNYDAVALWMRPGEHMDDILTFFRSGLWRLYYKLSSEGRARYYGEFLPLLHHTKQDVLGNRDNESYYLVYLGTKPSARGKGYARKLIEHGTRLADQRGLPVYLESSAAINVPYYSKLGFELKKQIVLQRSEKAIALDIMVREPSNAIITGTSKLKGGVMTVESSMK
ncbi:MAG: hypothetical protein M1818_006150 [Claussenomyces sp. TS43310]|nr:MAG: hypothetical protein M1818_006150 [Claussenomyces sp. TS43310]